MSISRPKRWRVHYPVQLFSEAFYDEGVAVNASSRGLSIAISRPLAPGTHIYVRLVVPERGDSIDFQMCRVHWRGQNRIGLETIHMDPGEEERWQRILVSGKACPTGECSTAPAVIEDISVSRIRDLIIVGWGLFTEKPALTELLKRAA